MIPINGDKSSTELEEERYMKWDKDQKEDELEYWEMQANEQDEEDIDEKKELELEVEDTFDGDFPNQDENEKKM